MPTNERAQKSDGVVRVSLTRPISSAARVQDVAATTWCLFQTVRANPISASAFEQFADSMLGASQIPIHERLASSFVDRVAHYAIVLTWDTYAGMVDDYAYYVDIFKEARRQTLIGKTVDEKKLRELVKRPNGNPRELTRRMELDVLDMLTRNQTSRWDAWVKSIKALRDHLAHGSGHIDMELESSTKFSYSWIRGAKLESFRTAETAATIDDADIVTKPVDIDQHERRAWFSPKPDALQGILASIVHVARLTFAEFRQKHAAHIVETPLS